MYTVKGELQGLCTHCLHIRMLKTNAITMVSMATQATQQSDAGPDETPAERASSHGVACSSQPELGMATGRLLNLSRFSCGAAAHAGEFRPALTSSASLASMPACMHARFTQQRSGQTTPARNCQASPRKASPVTSMHACITLYAKKLAGGSDTAQESAEVNVYCPCSRSSVNQRPGQDWPQGAHDTDG